MNQFFHPLKQLASLGLLLLAAVACTPAESAPTPAPTFTATALPPTPAPTPIIHGYSRSDPYARAETATAPGREVRVREVIRGDRAWELIKEANNYNDPPPAGQEYLLVKLSVLNTASVDEEQPVDQGDFKLTGDRLRRTYPAAVITPNPPLKGAFYPGGHIEGWVAFPVDRQEKNLMVMCRQLYHSGPEYTRFIALDEGAVIRVDPALADIPLTGVGASRANPARLGQTAATTDWQVTAQKAIRGKRAWELLVEANSYNDPPPEGMEYLLVLVKSRYIGREDAEQTVAINTFKSIGSFNVVYDQPSLVMPKPDLHTYVFPGGESEGWTALLIKTDELSPTLIFSPLFNRAEDKKRFFLLQE